ncbi:hypothetical protein I5J49_gp41 [Mycobacterium phage ThulaThula]|uniref:Uncharacterized protein n=1 Tax=Mycobacterium phage ThulaThula TaxID=2599880 RepID=A0A5J6TH99_9CAUD|nr:hypothetical protein I5J49_gp41 [Mycobacterium phage ThulaThula]QFG09069.1 hypothetical protein PBI_THULATHULA_41 [Mycobacterium phage ThulaThula]
MLMPTDDVATDAKAAAKGLARLIDRAYTAVSSDDDRAVIENLAGLLRHVSSVNVALATEIQHYAADAEQVRDERDELKAQVDELEAELEELRELRDGLAEGIAAACGGAR